MTSMLRASELGKDICEALGVPYSSVQRIAFAVDLNAPNEPVRLEITRLIDWPITSESAPSVQTVLERYFMATIEETS